MIDFYFWPTPNAYKVAVMLAEIGIPYRVMPINILEGEQHAPEFLDINPNGKVPAIVDPDGPDGKPIAIFESAVGRTFRPWYDKEVDPLYRKALGAIKGELDPNWIMNPGLLVDKPKNFKIVG
jgi:glutathione S-transferase-like protein/FAD-dependent oxidoreductase family protein